MSLPDNFVYLRDIDASIVEEIRYAGFHNFAGRPLPGYTAACCVLTRPAAEALAAVQRSVRGDNLTLKVYDAYRPQKAVDAIIRWCNDADDVLMQAEFYPRLQKSRIMPDGYLSPRSAHARGSTVDVTLVRLPAATMPRYTPGDTLVDATQPHGVRFLDNSIDMGTGYDAFDPLAHTDNPAIVGVARANRLRLKQVMQDHGFVAYDKEWWHFTLRDEPFATPFDFDITERSSSGV